MGFSVRFSIVWGFKKIFVCFYFMYFTTCICVYHIYAWGTQRPEEGARFSRCNVGTGYQSLTAPCFENFFF